MTTQYFPASAVTIFIALVSLLFVLIGRLRTILLPKGTQVPDEVNLKAIRPEPNKLTQALASALTESVILPQNAASFKIAMKSYWAQQECEVAPACVLRPGNNKDLCTAIRILKQEFDERRKNGEMGSEGIFAIRGGGHSPVPGAASINGGVLIDLSLFHEITPSSDGSRVVIGAGCKWGEVSRVLDEKGLAVVGGRNAAVGVGGLTLGGGLSFFSPRYGMVCANIISYSVVLASGSLVTASASSNPSLWRALKGGSNNFGIVTSFTAHAFPSTKIWSGFLYLPSFQKYKVLSLFHSSVNSVDSPKYDGNAAGPLASFSYVQAIGIKVIAINLCYTKLPEREKAWPACWETSGFRKLWRIWSTLKVQTLTSAYDELSSLNPPGRRQVFATTTIKNDAATLSAAYSAYDEAITTLRRSNVKGLVWTLVLQPLLPDWAMKRDPNPLGLENCTKPLVIVSFTVNWDAAENDEFVKGTLKETVQRIKAFAVEKGTHHPYMYLNYCAQWQKPFEGYGEKNLEFLKSVSKEYDPTGLFQKGCVGGFKLEREDLEG